MRPPCSTYRMRAPRQQPTTPRRSAGRRPSTRPRRFWKAANAAKPAAARSSGANKSLGVTLSGFVGGAGGAQRLSAVASACDPCGAGGAILPALGAMAGSRPPLSSAVAAASGGAISVQPSSFRHEIEGRRLGREPLEQVDAGLLEDVVVVVDPPGESQGFGSKSGAGRGRPARSFAGPSAHAGPLWRQRRLQNAMSLRMNKGSSSEMQREQCPQKKLLVSEAAIFRSAAGLARSVGSGAPAPAERHRPCASSMPVGDGTGSSSSTTGAIAGRLGNEAGGASEAGANGGCQKARRPPR
mmetsp:Transcript_119885/g.344411  ORF Transcript_119885/g.344411 Transcript_119885/m.344411 type:complete len:298 (+) Transcript_119885:259-1152(+)